MVNQRKDRIAQGFVEILPRLYNTLNQDTMNKIPAKQADLTHLQSHILETLYQSSQSVSITELAKNIDISKQQMTPIIHKLEENGYISKIRDVNDKRSFKIALSDTGKNVIKHKWENLYYIFCDKLEQLGEEEQIDLEYAIYKINHILTKIK